MAVVALVVHHHRPAAAAIASDVAEWLCAHGHTVRVGDDDARAIPRFAEWAVSSLPDDGSLVVSVGGDGTMLRAVHLAGSMPVLGLNAGHLGYLTVVEPAAWEPALQRAVEGDFEVVERMTLDVSGAKGGRWTALNDAVIEKLDPGHTVRVAMTVSGRPAVSYAADALIVSTPTGSTAYNLSAGGPLVSPRLDAIVVTPVAAHSFLGRAIVVAPDEVVRVEVLSGSAVVGIDGMTRLRLGVGDAIECRAGEQPARLITFGERDFWSILKAKFELNGD